MNMTLAEKILARAAGIEEVKPGTYVTAKIDMAMSHEAFSAVADALQSAGVKKVWDPYKIVCLLDHGVPAPTLMVAERHKRIRNGIKEFELKKNYYGESAGVCHQVMVEKGHVLPGMLIVGTDSHTTTYGALGAAGTGIGSTEMAYVFATGKLWFRVPETIKFEITGKLSPLVTSKDIILHIAGKYSVEVAQYKSVEFTGPIAEKMSVESRMTISNMSVELGAKFGFFEADEKTINYLKDFADEKAKLFRADPAAAYEKIYSIDVTGLEPQVAMPYSVDNVKAISKLDEVAINQAILGSCTNGRLEDLQMAAHILRGRKVHSGVRFLVIPASQNVYKKALEKNLINTFLDANAIVCNPSCGPCFGQHMGLLAAGEICVASINRNFRGRMGSNEAKVFLASPATVAASAVAGKIVDPRNYE